MFIDCEVIYMTDIARVLKPHEDGRIMLNFIFCRPVQGLGHVKLVPGLETVFISEFFYAAARLRDG